MDKVREIKINSTLWATPNLTPKLIYSILNQKN